MIDCQEVFISGVLCNVLHILSLTLCCNTYYFRIDPKEIDVLLAEITLLNTRAELYLRFLRRRIFVSTFGFNVLKILNRLHAAEGKPQNIGNQQFIAHYYHLYLWYCVPVIKGFYGLNCCLFVIF